MKKHQILIVSEAAIENRGIVHILSKEPDWQVSLAQSAEEAITLFYARPFDITVVGKDINNADEQKLRAVLGQCSFENIVLKQHSDNMEMLKKEIMGLLSRRKIEKWQRIHVTDSFNPVNQADKIRIVPFEG